VADGGIDIVVTSPTGHFGLVVEVKLQGDLDAATSRLGEYMRRVGTNAGLLVVRDVLRILADTYRGDPSIKVVGEFPTSLARGLRASAAGVDFEDSVQRWLESLQNGEDVAAEPLRSALAAYILPALAEGSVRAAGPRAQAAAG
jgi:hypothetical protein